MKKEKKRGTGLHERTHMVVYHTSLLTFENSGYQLSEPPWHPEQGFCAVSKNCPAMPELKKPVLGGYQKWHQTPVSYLGGYLIPWRLHGYTIYVAAILN